MLDAPNRYMINITILINKNKYYTDLSITENVSYLQLVVIFI